MNRQSLFRGIVGSAAVAALALGGCGEQDHATSVAKAAIATVGSGSEATSPSTATTGYPSSIAVLGHSGATGEDSDPSQPHVEIRANSWATGTNPAVNSVYLRILAKNPAIKGHHFNLAQAGATVDRLIVQAQQAVALTPKPQLFLVQIMDNDIVCPAHASDYAGFRTKLLTALAILHRGAPNARMFLVSQWGSPPTYWKALSPAQRRAYGSSSPQGPCQFLTPKGKPVPNELARLDGIIHHYEAQLKAACTRTPRCTYDGGAFGRQIDMHRFISEDLNHFSAKGHAAAAAVAWSTMRRLGVIPR